MSCYQELLHLFGLINLLSTKPNFFLLLLIESTFIFISYLLFTQFMSIRAGKKSFSYKMYPIVIVYVACALLNLFWLFHI
jgi:hypothetical protein